jgi:hypothetical protein
MVTVRRHATENCADDRTARDTERVRSESGRADPFEVLHCQQVRSNRRAATTSDRKWATTMRVVVLMAMSEMLM